MKSEDELRELLSDLWCREITGQLGRLEKEHLQKLIKEYGLASIDRRRLIDRLGSGPEFDDMEAYREFQRQRKNSGKRNIGMIWRVGVTVAAIVLLFLGIWFVWPKADKIGPIAQLTVEKEVIEPGSRKAIITLANGKEIILGDNKQQLHEENGTLLKVDSIVVEYKENQEATDVVYNTIYIPAGGEYQLILADGSRVWMNADSRLKYPVNFTGERREVYLEGEAYFEVMKDKGHAFVVHTSRGAIEVLGTGFNVRDYREEQKVVTTLVQGRVAYHSEKQPDKEIILEPGFQLEDQAGGELQPRKVDVLLYTGWKDGKYVFENAMLEEIMQVLSKWYDIAVFYKREEVKELHFTGDLERYKTINEFLEFMEIGGNVQFSIKGKTVIVE